VTLTACFGCATSDAVQSVVGPAGSAIALGADVQIVQQMLGHKTATMALDLYEHLFPGGLGRHR
jgi:hypothetical protein